MAKTGTNASPAKTNDINLSVLMSQVFGDRLQGLSEAEIEYVKTTIEANLDKVKAEAKKQAAWAEVISDIAEVVADHGKADVVKGQVLRIAFDDNGKASQFKLHKVRSTTGANASGMVKQYRLKGSEKWETTTTWAAVCNALGFPINGRSAKRVLEGKGYETQIVKAVS